MPRRLVPLFLLFAAVTALWGAYGGARVVELRNQAAIAHADQTLATAARFLDRGNYVPPKP